MVVVVLSVSVQATALFDVTDVGTGGMVRPVPVMAVSLPLGDIIEVLLVGLGADCSEEEPDFV